MREKATSCRPEDPLSPPPIALWFQVLPCCRAQRGRVVGSESKGELNWLFLLQVQLRSRRCRSKVSLAPEKIRGKEGPGLLLLSLGAAARPCGFSEPKVVRRWARFICCALGQERACPAAARAAVQSASGPGGHASPLRPPRGTAGFRTKGWGRGRGTSLCLRSPRGLCPSNSRFLKGPRPVSRVLSSSRLAVSNRFAPILVFLGICPDLFLVS